jgi:hypothetical protein
MFVLSIFIFHSVLSSVGHVWDALTATTDLLPAASAHIAHAGTALWYAIASGCTLVGALNRVVYWYDSFALVHSFYWRRRQDGELHQ